MKAKILNEKVVYDIPHFSYLEKEEKEDILKKILECKAISVCIVNEKDDPKLYSILEFHKDCIYVREVCGKSIYKHIKWLEVFAHALAKRYKKKLVSFCAQKDGIKMIGQKLGYVENENGEFEKAVS